MRKRNLTWAVASLSFIGFGSGLAAETVTTAASDFWNNHIGGYADIRIGTNLIVGPMVSIYNGNYSESGGWAWGGDLGYSLNRHFGIEAGFAQSYQKSQDDGNDTSSEGHLNIPYAAMKFTAPIGHRAALFLKLGAMYLIPDFPGTNEKSQTYPFEGLGVSYALTSKVDLTAQFQGSFMLVYNMGVAGVGLTYHF